VIFFQCRAGRLSEIAKEQTMSEAQFNPSYMPDQPPVSAAIQASQPPFNLPPLPKTRRAEICVPASVNGRDMSQGKP
jgi:hypothetical protein